MSIGKVLGLMLGGFLAIMFVLFLLNFIVTPYLTVTTHYQDDKKCILKVEGHDFDPWYLGGTGVSETAELQIDECYKFLTSKQQPTDWFNTNRKVI